MTRKHGGGKKRGDETTSIDQMEGENVCVKSTGEASGRAARVVTPPQLDAAWQIEYSVHRVSPAMATDIKAAFRNEMVQELCRLGVATADERNFYGEHLLAIPTWQPAPTFDTLLKGDWASAELDLSVYPSQEVNKVRKMMYLKLKAWAGKLRQELAKKNYWLDAACPITGSCMFGERSSSIYNELEGLTHMLGYDSMPVGCCGIVFHPRWGKAAYPCTLVTFAPPDALAEALETVSQQAAMPDVAVVTEARELVEGDSCI